MQRNANLVDLETSKMQQKEYLVAIVAVDTAENEPLKVWGKSHSLFIRLLSADLVLREARVLGLVRRIRGENLLASRRHLHLEALRQHEQVDVERIDLRKVASSSESRLTEEKYRRSFVQKLVVLRY